MRFLRGAGTVLYWLLGLSILIGIGLVISPGVP